MSEGFNPFPSMQERMGCGSIEDMRRQFQVPVLLVFGMALLWMMALIALGAGERQFIQSPTITVRGPIIGGVQPPIGTPLPVQTFALSEGRPIPTIAPTTAATPFRIRLPNLNPEMMGVQLEVNLSDEDWAEAMRRVTDNLSVRWIKLQIPWREMQPDRPDQIDAPFFRRVERYIEDANRRGLNVLLSIAKAPAWARTVLEEDGPPDDPQALADFLTLLLREINPNEGRELVGDYIDAIEIWNEPNLRREWQGTLPFTGAGYMQLFVPAYNAVRAASPTLPIITAGLAPTSNTAGSVDDIEFLQQMYAAGLGQYTDIFVGAHPFSWGNAPDALCCGTRGWDDNPHFFFAETIRSYRQIMSANGHDAVKLWVTEFGWASWDGFPNEPPPGSEWMRFNDKWTQAQYTIRAFEIMQTADYFAPAILWNLNFAVLNNLVNERDERIAYSLMVPGSAGVVDVESDDVTERPLYWMIYDAVRPDIQLERYD